MLSLTPLQPADLDAVQALDLECFAGDAFAVRWWHKALEGQGAAAWLAREGDTLLGYCLFSRVLDEAELLRIACAPAARQRGIALALLNHAMTQLEQQGTRQLFLEVRASNLAAQQLYHRAGWHETGRRKDYYPLEVGREDALLFGCERPGDAGQLNR
ncbi:ribosomal protein S18-alanine N-acetyltransferase [Marinobacterium weihaiense]|uniref:Ribosomal protein S18-alanine N-acetyltransferase n=1 Tax=Marinobacterium weihaiense TaxID=2851016 RepID=A0ABS6M9M4_9GAMM|nr:ribosomal protein S18-alanine N-acetyltransferase [Marinobacterium weihaiense]MBV0932477.1 ribosomal protein S18-alanine N-acetyltransferase [Marinobacterium weihaiense]